MARLWSCGFELSSVTDGVEVDTGNGSIVTDFVHGGTYSNRISTSATTKVANHSFATANQTAQFYFRMYVYFVTIPDAQSRIMSIINAAGTVKLSIRINSTSDGFEAHNTEDSAVIGTQSGAGSITTGVWYRLEMSVDTTTIASTAVACRLNGTSFGSGTVNLASGIATMGWGVGGANATADIRFDDFAINDDTGTSENSWPGEGKIAHLFPDGAGDNNNALSGDYTSVDDKPTPDDGTTIAVLDADNDILDVTVESSATGGIASTDVVKLVQVGIREAAFSAAQESWALRIKSASGGTTTQGTTTTHNDITYRTNGDALHIYTLTSYTDPTTGVAWTPTGTNSLDNMQIGVKAIDATPDINVSALWALVEYRIPTTVALNTPADSATGVSTTPDLAFTGTNTGDDIEYQFQLDTGSGFSSQSTGGSVNVILQGWGGGASGGSINVNPRGGGGGGGAFTQTNAYEVTSGTGYTVTVGTGGASVTGPNNGNNGNDTSFVDSSTFLAKGGVSGKSNGSAGAGGAAASGVGDIRYSGGSGAAGGTGVSGGGGESGGTSGDGAAASGATGGSGNNADGGDGANGDTGTAGTAPGGGGGGRGSNGASGAGADGKVIIKALLGTITSATGGTHTTDATYDIWTFTSSGTWTPTIPGPLLNKFSVTPDATFTDVTNGADTHPFAAGDQVKYTVQVGNTLNNTTVYYWRVRGIAPSGSNTYSPWATTRSFTTVAAGGGGVVLLNIGQRRRRGFGY